MSKLMDKLKALNAKSYVEQAKFYLNAYWTEKFADNVDAREDVYQKCMNIIKLDVAKGTKGCKLNEIKAHLFLEKNAEACTWTNFREVMKSIDVDFDNCMSLVEFFIYNDKVDWKQLVGREKVYGAEAQKALDAANAALDAANEAMQQSRKADAEAKEAHKAAEDALNAQKKAEEEVRLGLETIQKEEDKKARKVAKFKALSEDESLSTVKRGKAFQEYKKADGEDPLPLRKAKLEQKAKVRKAKKATRVAKKKANKAEAASKAAAEALQKAETAFEEASATVQNLASSLGGAGEGTLWFMDRELEEAAKFLPKSKQRALRKKMAAQKAALLGKEVPAKKGKKKGRKKKKKAVSADAKRAEVGVGITHVKLKKTKKKKKASAAARAKMTMEVTKGATLKHVETHGDDGPSEAVKAAFVEDQKDKGDDEAADE